MVAGIVSEFTGRLVKYSDREIRTVTRYYIDLGPEILGERFGRSPKAVANKAWQLCATKRRRYFQAEEDRLIVCCYRTLGAIAIGRLLGRMEYVIRKRAGQLGVSSRAAYRIRRERAKRPK